MTVMATAVGATHNDFVSTVYYTVWWRANNFCALETSPLRPPVAVQILRVSPEPEDLSISERRRCMEYIRLPTIQDTCNQPLTPGHFKIIISELKSRGLILAVCLPHNWHNSWMACLQLCRDLGMLLIDLIYDVPSFVPRRH